MRSIAVLFLMFFMFSCTDGLDRLSGGDDILTKEEMIAVTKDMVKLESFVQTNYRNVAEYHKIMITSGDSILKKHGVTRAQYTGSMEYYGSRHSEMQDIYSEILDELNKEMAELQAK